jgi:hypothetical protein
VLRTGCGEQDRRGRREPERLADALAGASSVRVPVQLPDKLAAVLMAEVAMSRASSSSTFQAYQPK